MRGTVSGREPNNAGASAILTIPNFITIFRFLGTPLFVWLVLAKSEYGWGVFVLAVMGCTDWIDGFVARKLNQTSQLGRILDPLADRVALVTVIITLVIAHILPVWMLITMLVPDIVLLGFTLYWFHGDANLKVTMFGKTRTALLLIGTPLLLLAKATGSQPATDVAFALLTIGMVMHVASFFMYFRTLRAKHKALHGNSAAVSS